MFFFRQKPKFNKNRGALLVLILVLGGVFFVITSAFIGYIVTQSKVVEQRYILNRSIEVAEAGINYYKWYLHHNTADVAAALPPSGSETHIYSHPEDGNIGEYTISVASTTYCGTISSIDVTSTGYTYDDPSLTRTISARFVRPTVANYSYILDANVWAGSDRQIYGPYHSNQGIRMDGTNHSVVSSGLETWDCEDQCSPDQNGVDGVFTTTANADQSLFVFPSTPVSFGSFVNDMDDIEEAAENHGGFHKDPSSYYGYLVQFIGGGQLRVTEVRDTYRYRNGSGYYERHIIEDLGTSEVWTINQDCPVVFIDDKVWLEAESGADLDELVSVVSTDTIILQGDIEYANPDEDGLLAIAEDDILIGVDVPDNMDINGIFIAQEGHFGRNHYNYDWLPDPSGSLNFRPYYKRNSLDINGTIVSKGSVGTKWVSGSTYKSGFEFRTNTYDRNLVDNPPPLVPNTSDNYILSDWREAD
ncbi:hypothetical protein KC851_01020 [Candidatus Kaiserbacteria bacterium]|nr:hypothetical protein [Candidatus Kaiserbacteria bacterium]